MNVALAIVALVFTNTLSCPLIAIPASVLAIPVPIFFTVALAVPLHPQHAGAMQRLPINDY